MAQHNGGTSHSAADLLRQAIAQNSARHEEDGHDHIGSSSPTPSGAETPHPDLSDKRLPGIMHSYFGQVGSRPSSSHLSRPLPRSTAPPPYSTADNTQEEQGFDEGKSRSTSASSGSIVMVKRGQGNSQSLSRPISELTRQLSEQDLPDTDASNLPPTPLSPSSSLLQRESESAENGKPLVDGGIGSVTQALKDLVMNRGPLGLKARRHQSLPLSSLATNPVLAAHISNPTTSHPSPAHKSTESSAPESPEHSDKPPSPVSVKEPNKLTSDAAPESRIKTTPPHTPRALSHESVPREKKSPLGGGAAAKLSQEWSNGAGEVEKPADESSVQSQTTPLPVRSPKGKLAVKIDEARGLRPSVDPYVVCVFEWNEYISKGPKNDDMDIDEDSKGPKPGLKEALSSVPIRRTDSDIGVPMSIPMKDRQASNNSNMDDSEHVDGVKVTNPRWDHEAMFDVLGRQSEIDITVYDRSSEEEALGHLRLCLNLSESNPVLEGWFPLEARASSTKAVTGEIHLRMHFTKTDKRQFGPNDFEILKLIGKGTFGQVYQVRKKDTRRIYAMKVLSKKVIIQKKEVAHTIGERNILVRTAMADSAFIVGLKFSFQTSTDLYLVTDFMSGGELFWHLQKEGRFKEDRAKFYIAELILALQHLHQHDIVYRDLKPENILLDANGHIALCDFGLSKANLTKNDTTNTFCGTTEYLAPEVLLDEQGYTKMVDFWSLGVLVFEMCCGWSPFYAEDTQQMYKNIAFGKVRFPRDALSTEGRNFVKGLLNRNPKHRLGANRDAQELIEHPFFDDIDWVALGQKNLDPPFKPKLKSQTDTSNFDPEFTNALNTSSSLNARAAALAAGAMPASTPLSPTMQNAFRGFTFVDESTMESQFGVARDGADEAQEDDENYLQASRSREHRMSGVQKTGGEDSVFGQENFDM